MNPTSATYFALDPVDSAKVAQELATRIQADTAPGVWLALFDEAFDYNSKKLSWPGARYPLYHQGRLAPLATVSPSLLELNPAHHATALQWPLARMLQHCAGKPMLGFVKTTVSAEVLRTHWQGCLQPHTEDGQSLLLRFADTRVSAALPAALAPASWLRLTAPVTQWLVPDRSGVLQSLPLADTNTPADSSIDAATDWTLTDAEYSALLGAGEADALVQAVHEQWPDALPTTEKATFHIQIAQACSLLQKHRIEAAPDQIALAAAVCATHGQLLDAPGLDGWLARRTWNTGQMALALAESIDKGFE